MNSINVNQVGEVVSCVIGTPHDATWCPNAQVLLLKSEEPHHTTRFHALAKKPNGDIEILFGVTKRPEGMIADDRGWGEYYCTHSINYTNGEFERLPLVKLQAQIDVRIAYYNNAINALPAYTELAGSL
jgi:hypothetical protein